MDALPYHEAGGSAAQELGSSLATGVAYLRELTEAGLSVQQAVAQFGAARAAADQFLTIAKLRAARRLWARVTEVCGTPGGQVQHAVTSPVMMSRRDPWVNMLRTTVATLAAGVGGADAVTVLPFDHALGLPDAFARRIARNASTILVEVASVPGDRPGGRLLVRGAAHRTNSPMRAGSSSSGSSGRAAGGGPALRTGFGEDLAAPGRRAARGFAKRREPSPRSASSRTSPNAS